MPLQPWSASESRTATLTHEVNDDVPVFNRSNGKFVRRVG